MTRTQKAALLKISAEYLSSIYHGKRVPSEKLIKEWESVIGKDAAWWKRATLPQIQRTLDAIK